MLEPNFKQLFADAFGRDLNARELWVITRFAKRVRKFARNNSAFNNLANRAFPYATFRQVQKQGVDKYTGQPRSYEGLQITVKGETAGDSDDE